MAPGGCLSTVTAADLASALKGDPEALDVHLLLVERDVALSGKSTKIHVHCLTVDGNGRLQIHRLAEFMRNAVVDYAIPRSKLAAAKARDIRFNSTEAVTELVEQAKRSFTDLANTGEGGELLLFLLAERFLQLPQILCKMDLKTDTRVHYHGADGVYAGVAEDGILKLYWGESKIYADPAAAIRECLKSLVPFLLEPEHEEAGRERDLVLLSDKADLTDPAVTNALRKYFDKTSVMSKRVRYCGLGLVGFDADIYPKKDAKAILKDIEESCKNEIARWKKLVEDRLGIERLDDVEIHILCLPLPSADSFRSSFLKAMGIKEE